MSPATEKLATGGGDSVVNMWTDCTIDDEEEAIRQEVKPMTSTCSVIVASVYTLHLHVRTNLFHPQTAMYSTTHIPTCR